MADLLAYNLEFTSIDRSSSADRPLRIALVHTAEQGGGAELSTLSLHLALQRLGHESQMYVGVKRGDAPDVHEIKRFRCFPGVLRGVLWIEQMTGWQYIYQPWFHRLDKLLGPDVDVVHYSSLWYGKFGFADVAALPRLTRLYPSFITLRDWWMLTGHCAHPAIGCERWKTGCGHCPDLTLPPAIPVDGTRFNWNRKRRAIQKSQLRVTTVSNWLGGLVSESPIFAGKQVHTVYNGINDEAFYPRHRFDMRRKHGLPADEFIVMVAGQSVEGTSGQTKGAAAYALEALAASERQPFLLAVGRSAGKLVAAWGGRGQAIEFQTDPAVLAEIYCAADVVLVASLWETFGRVPAEAQMCGVPVAGFATGGIPEVVEHNVTGLIVERMNSSALGQAIRTLHDQPELRAQLGLAGAQRASVKFNNQAIAQQYVDLYRAEIALRQQSVRVGGSH